MKRVLFVLIAIGFVSSVIHAQIFSVGDKGCNYTVLNHTVNLADPPLPGYYSYVKNYSIDIDGDLTNDVVFDWFRNGTPGGSSYYRQCILKCTSPTNYEFVHLPSTVSCSTSLIMENLPVSMPLTGNLNWGLATNSCLYTYCLGVLACNSFCMFGNYYPSSISYSYLGFRKILTNDTIYGWIHLKTNEIGNDEVVSYAYKHTASNSSVTPVFTNTLAPLICEGSVINLSASPAGGVFYGLGVSGNTLNTGICGGGIHNIYYNKGCGTAMLTITVNPLPIVFTNSLLSVCNGDSIVLTAAPPGGVFFGTGVSGNTFYSSVPGLGNSVISYSYTDVNGCSTTKTTNISVQNSPNLKIASTASMSCPGSSVTLSVSGASSYSWSTGSNNASIVVSPTATTTYTVVGAFATGGCPSGTISITQLTGNPNVVAYGYPTGNICQGNSANIHATGASSYSWSTGATTPSLSVSPGVTTTYSVIGTSSGGCSNTAVTTVTVNPNVSITAIPNKSVTCPGDTLILNLSGSSSYSICSSSSSSTYFISSGPNVILTPTATVTYTVYAKCSPPAYVSHIVASCVGIDELSNSASLMQIFPNPNNGEFEIKGLKEEAIFISNELGQLIATKNLTQENNYSVKLSNLQSGVYFVGNKLSRLKVVVIK